MWIYVILILILFGIAFISMLFKNKILNILVPLCLCALIAIVFCGMKNDSIGTDTAQYHKIFNDIAANDFSYCFKTKTEFGFSIFTKLISYVSKSFVFYNFVFYSLIWASLAFFSYTFCKKPCFCFALIFAFTLQFALSAYRQILAVSTVLVGCSLFRLQKNKILASVFFVLFFLVSITFHLSALVGLLFPISYILMKRFNFNFYLCIGFLVVFFFCSQSIYYFFTTLINQPYPPHMINSFPSTVVMSGLVFCFSYFFNFNKHFVKDTCAVTENASEIDCKSVSKIQKLNSYLIIDQNSTPDIYLKTATLLSLVAALSMSFCTITSVLTRIFVYFEIPLALTIINTIINRKNKKIEILFLVLIAILAVLYFCIALRRSGYITNYVPYKTFFM